MDNLAPLATADTGWFSPARFAPAHHVSTLAEMWKAAFGFFALFLGLYVVTLQAGPFFLSDMHRFIVGRDFLNLWMAGKLALGANPGQFYDPNLYDQAMVAIIGKGYQENILSYPPTQFLLGLPFGLLPYPIAYVAWMSLNIAALHYAVKGMFTRPLLLLLLVSPAALVWLLCGQCSLITAALIIAALRMLPAAPWKAGICIGLLIIKPQLALFFPLLLIATGQWRAFLTAGITVLLILAVTYAGLGPEPWIAYYTLGIPEHISVFVHPTDMVTSLTPTIFNDLVVLGVDAAIGFKMQVGLTLLAAVGLVLGLRRSTDPTYRFLLFVTASVLATVYMLSYDLIALNAALLLFLSTHALQKREIWLFTACFWLPLLDFFFNAYGIPGPSLLPLVLLGWLLFVPRDRLHSAT